MDARLSSTPLETWAIAPTGEVRSRIGALASRLASGACVDFATYGGSVVAGVGCCAGQRLACSAAEHQNCSFAARFVQQLRDDGACVTGRNLAVGASTTASSVGMLSHMPAGLAAPSLVMVDFSVNDIYDTAAARMVAYQRGGGRGSQRKGACFASKVRVKNLTPRPNIPGGCPVST